jgi:hypothetical protein
MRNLVIVMLAALSMTVCSVPAGGESDETSCPLVFGMNVSCRAHGDTTKVVALAVADNDSDRTIEICGSFEFTARYEPDSVLRAEGRIWPTFIVLDPADMDTTLNCDPVVLGPYDRISDSFTFSYSPRDFTRFPGRIEIQATFVYGSPGMSWNAAKRCAPEALRASINVPRLRP